MRPGYSSPVPAVCGVICQKRGRLGSVGEARGDPGQGVRWLLLQRACCRHCHRQTHHRSEINLNVANHRQHPLSPCPCDVLLSSDPPLVSGCGRYLPRRVRVHLDLSPRRHVCTVAPLAALVPLVPLELQKQQGRSSCSCISGPGNQNHCRSGIQPTSALRLTRAAECPELDPE